MTARRPRLAADLAIAAPQTLSLLDGENLSPAYLKVQPTGTVPALVDLQGEVLDSTIKVVKYLVANAPRKPESWEPATPEIVEAFHACVVLRRLARYRSPC
jgi:glutathione S-transferase